MALADLGFGGGLLRGPVYSQDGRHILACCDSELRVYSALTGDHLATLRGHVSELTCAALDPKSASQVIHYHILNVTRRAEASCIHNRFTWDCTLLMIGRQQLLQPGATHSNVSRTPHVLFCIQQVYTASLDGSIRLWDFLTGACIKTYAIKDPIASLVVSANHDIAYVSRATSGQNGTGGGGGRVRGSTRCETMSRLVIAAFFPVFPVVLKAVLSLLQAICQ